MEAKPRHYVNDLADLTEPHHVLLIGSVCPEWVVGIADLTADNLEVVLTQPRLQYIRSKADGRIRFLDLALQAVLDPDEVHRDRHPNNAIFYKRLGPRGYLKAVVWLQREKIECPCVWAQIVSTPSAISIREMLTGWNAREGRCWSGARHENNRQVGRGQGSHISIRGQQ